jgi:toxin FitB
MEDPACHRFQRAGFQVIRYLLDTNVVSELRRVRPHGAVVAWLTALRPEQIYISAVTMAELQAGVELARQQNPAKAQEIEAWLNSVEATFALIPMDSACFRESARLMAGKPESLQTDAMIAATARIHGLSVATRNERDFAHLNIRVANPFKA